jgi:diphthamide biosynthesis methyltransferase
MNIGHVCQPYYCPSRRLYDAADRGNVFRVITEMSFAKAVRSDTCMNIGHVCQPYYCPSRRLYDAADRGNVFRVITEMSFAKAVRSDTCMHLRMQQL